MIPMMIYRLMERTDGEKGLKLVPYWLARRVKWQMLRYLS